MIFEPQIIYLINTTVQYRVGATVRLYEMAHRSCNHWSFKKKNSLRFFILPPPPHQYPTSQPPELSRRGYFLLVYIVP